MDSFFADFFHGVSGELTSKHLLAHGLHYITGNKETMQITNRLGHCGSYNTVLDIETVQAQKAVTLMNNANTSVLPLQQKSDEETVLTVFWAENFDKNVDKETGGGAMNMATIMAFQESAIGALGAECKVSVPKTKSRMVTLNFDKHSIVFYDKHESNITSFERVENESNGCPCEFSCKFFTWLFLCHCNRFEQIYPNLSEMLLRLWQKQFNKSAMVSKTIETYFPPLTTKFTDPQTIFSYLKYFQGLAKEMNMPYINVTLDVGAAINAYKHPSWGFSYNQRKCGVTLPIFRF